MFAEVAMPQPPRALLIVAASLALALVADLLLRGASWGINLGLLSLAVAGTALWLEKRTHVRLPATGRLFGLLSAVFALLFSLRDSDALKAANAAALVFCLGGLLLSTTGDSLRDSTFLKLLIGPIRQWIRLPAQAIALGNRARHEGSPSPKIRQRTLAAMKGLGLALPLLLVFGGLFASADPIFRKNLEGIFQPSLDFQTLNGHAVTFLLSLGFVAGLFHALIMRDDRPETPVASTTVKGRIGAIEMGIVLGSLNLLFASFIAVQFRYLFGASQTVGLTPGLSYAEYARGGFFELVWVAALAFVVLLGTDALLKREEGGSESLFRWIGRGLVLMVFCVVGSALMRMKLYTDAFGLTELRVYSTVFMVWLSTAFAWMLATTLNRRPRRFAFGALMSGLGVIFCTNLVNPDRLMARTNLSKPNADFAYLMSLSDDAILAVREAQGGLPEKYRPAYIARLQQLQSVARADWRELNLARWILTH